MALTSPSYFSLGLPVNSPASGFMALTSVPATAVPPGYQRVSGDVASIVIVPFGEGTDGQTFSLRIVGVRLDQTGTVLMFQPLAVFACALCTDAGDAVNDLVGTGELFCDTITVTAGAPTVQVIQPGENVRANILMDMQGCYGLVFDFDMGNATNGNVIYSML